MGPTRESKLPFRPLIQYPKFSLTFSTVILGFVAYLV
jgi:hypothetical protein